MIEFERLSDSLKSHPRTWLVTGAAGFIGSNLIEHLLALDQIVVGLDNFATGYQHNLAQGRDLVSDSQWARFSFIEGDIRAFEDCERAVKGVDYVLHQAALGSVPRSMKEPIMSHDANVTGMIHMLTAAREAGRLRLPALVGIDCEVEAMNSGLKKPWIVG